MDIRIEDQAAALALSLAIGMGIGLLYDLLRPARRHGGKVLAILLDGVFALAAGMSMFSFAMAADNGRLGTWELAGALLGFLLYMHALSAYVLPVVDRIFQTTGKIYGKIKKIIKKIHNLAKNLFPKIRECFIIKK